MMHNSIGLGENGPTHQPVEQLAALRAIPHLAVYRPGGSGKIADVYKKFDITTDAVVRAAREVLREVSV